MRRWMNKEIEGVFEKLCQTSPDMYTIKPLDPNTPCFQIEIEKKPLLFLAYKALLQWKIYLKTPDHNSDIGFIRAKKNIGPDELLATFQNAFDPTNQALLEETHKALAGLTTALNVPIIKSFCNPTKPYCIFNMETHDGHVLVDMTPNESKKTYDLLTTTAYASYHGKICTGGTLGIDLPKSNHERLFAYETARKLMPRTLRKIEKMKKTEI